MDRGGAHKFLLLTEEIMALRVSRGGSVFFKATPGRPIRALGDVYMASRNLA